MERQARFVLMGSLVILFAAAICAGAAGSAAPWSHAVGLPEAGFAAAADTGRAWMLRPMLPVAQAVRATTLEPVRPRVATRI